MTKKKKGHRKPRTTDVTVDFGKPVAITQVVQLSDGSVQFRSSNGVEVPVDARVETNYARPKVPKSLHRVPLPPSQLAHDPNVALTKYTWIVAVDTNKPEASLPNVAFVGIVFAQVVQTAPSLFRVRIFGEDVAEIHNTVEPKERIGWLIACKSIINLAVDATVAIIVDSELSRLANINARTEAIFGDYKLPERFTLLYASSDVGNEYLPNQFIRVADKNARLVARHVASTLSGQLPPLKNAAPEDPFTHIRVWKRPVSTA